MRIIQELKPSLVVTDSVQQIEEYNGGRGAKNIVRKARTALSYGGHLIFISQLTVGKTPRGGTALPHEVDIVCTLERWDPVAPPIFVMTVGKNRFGTTGRQVLFAHKEDGVECQSQMRLADTDWAMSHGTRVRSMIGWRLVEEPTPAKREGILMGCIKGIFGRRSNTAST
jgi:predicted ATP-dependent serine protease